MRPNERFSGRGHARHLCRDCSKLGPAELAYRQGVRAIDRLVGWGGTIPRRHRKTFESFLLGHRRNLDQHGVDPEEFDEPRERHKCKRRGGWQPTPEEVAR